MGRRIVPQHKISIILVAMLLTWALPLSANPDLSEEPERTDSPQISLSSESSYLMDLGYMHETVNAMAYAPNGDLIVGGAMCALYYLPDDPEPCQITIDGADVSSNDFAPAYLLTLGPDGNSKDIQIISSSGGDRVDAIAFAQNGDMLVGGSACWLQPTSCTLTGFGISLPVVDDGGDAWFARLGPGGEAVWSFMIGSKGFDTIHSIAESPDGSIYVAGTFCQNTNLLCKINIGDQEHQSNGGADVMIAKLSSDGDVLWSKSFGSGSTDTDMFNSWYALMTKGIVATPDGGLLFAGWGCEGWNSNCYMNIASGYNVANHNSFIVKYAGNGTVDALSVINGDAADYIQVMTPIDENRVIVAGNHYSSTLYAGSLSVYNSGGSDAWYAVFNHSSWQYESLWDSKSPGNEVFHSAAVTPEGHYILGGTQCWGSEDSDCPVSFDTGNGMDATRESYTDGGEGFLMLHDTEWNSIAWMRGITENDVGISYLSDVAVSATGNIAANFPVCVTDNNTGCNAGIAGDKYTDVHNATLVYQITFDADGDGVFDANDLCLASPEIGWQSDYATDIDGDGCRDADQDSDDDGDGTPDESDLFPMDPMEWLDTDLDGVGDNQDKDDDSDGWSDSMEVDCGGTDIIDPASFPLDTDGDGECNYLDEDDDGDDVLDILDAFPLEICASLDRDLDGMPNQLTVPGCPTSLLVDPDDDNDGVLDADDVDPLDSDVGGDSDGDGMPDWVIGDAVTRYDQDSDDDNDGVMDVDDAFPLIPTESVDSDGDGIGDNTDTDDDGDGWSDYDEIQCNSDPMVSTDTPGDADDDGTCDLMESSLSFESYAPVLVVLVLLAAAGIAISARAGQKSLAPALPPSPPPLPDEDED